MQDYCKTFDNQSASTEDFKAIVEKHMTKAWTSTEITRWTGFSINTSTAPACPSTPSMPLLTPTPDGKTSVSAQLLRSGVPDNWKDACLFTHMWATKSSGWAGLLPPIRREALNFVIPGKVDKITIDE